jgi:hypothetical protein
VYGRVYDMPMIIWQAQIYVEKSATEFARVHSTLGPGIVVSSYRLNANISLGNPIPKLLSKWRAVSPSQTDSLHTTLPFHTHKHNATGRREASLYRSSSVNAHVQTVKWNRSAALLNRIVCWVGIWIARIQTDVNERPIRLDCLYCCKHGVINVGE